MIRKSAFRVLITIVLIWDERRARSKSYDICGGGGGPGFGAIAETSTRQPAAVRRRPSTRVRRISIFGSARRRRRRAGHGQQQHLPPPRSRSAVSERRVNRSTATTKRTRGARYKPSVSQTTLGAPRSRVVYSGTTAPLLCPFERPPSRRPAPARPSPCASVPDNG